MKNLKFYILLFFISMLVVLAISELGLRKLKVLETNSEREGKGYFSFYKAYNSGNSHYHKFNNCSVFSHCKPEFCYEVKANCEGFIYDNFSDDTSFVKVLFFGDSFCEGVGAPQDSAYPLIFEKNLRSNKYNVEIFNAGVSGSDIVFQLKLFEDLLKFKNPDFVVLTLNSTDIVDVMIRGGKERFKKNGKTEFKSPPSVEFFYEYSHLARLIILRLLGYNNFLIHKNELQSKKDEAASIINSTINQFNFLSQKHNFQLLILFHPTFPEFQGLLNYEVIPNIDYCKTNNIEYYDFKKCLETMTIEEIKSLYWPIDGHFNIAGYKLLGEFLAANFLSKNRNFDRVHQSHPQP
jgi:lysophospholipase L1-like esterase